MRQHISFTFMRLRLGLGAGVALMIFFDLFEAHMSPQGYEYLTVLTLWKHPAAPNREYFLFTKTAFFIYIFW